MAPTRGRRRRGKVEVGEARYDDIPVESEGDTRDEEDEEEEEEEEDEDEPQAEVIGPPVKKTGRGKSEKKFFEAFELEGVRYNLEDFVMVQQSKNEEKPYVSVVKEIWQGKDGAVKITGQWFYRPEETEKKGGGKYKGKDPRELFYSFHKDIVPAEAVMHKCVIHFIPPGKQAPIANVQPGFLCRGVYDPVDKKVWSVSDRDFKDAQQREIDELIDRTRQYFGECVEMSDSVGAERDSRHNGGNANETAAPAARKQGGGGRLRKDGKRVFESIDAPEVRLVGKKEPVANKAEPQVGGASVENSKEKAGSEEKEGAGSKKSGGKGGDLTVEVGGAFDVEGKGGTLGANVDEESELESLFRSTRRSKTGVKARDIWMEKLLQAVKKHIRDVKGPPMDESSAAGALHSTGSGGQTPVGSAGAPEGDNNRRETDAAAFEPAMGPSTPSQGGGAGMEGSLPVNSEIAGGEIDGGEQEEEGGGANGKCQRDGQRQEEDVKGYDHCEKDGQGCVEEKEKSESLATAVERTVCMICKLEEEAHRQLGADPKKYNLKMRSLEYNLRNGQVLSRRVITGELDSAAVLHMSPTELKDGYTVTEKELHEPEEPETFQMTDARCKLCGEKQMAVKDIIHVGYGDRYQLECLKCGHARSAPLDAVSSLRVELPKVSPAVVGVAPWATSKFSDIEPDHQQTPRTPFTSSPVGLSREPVNPASTVPACVGDGAGEPPVAFAGNVAGSSEDAFAERDVADKDKGSTGTGQAATPMELDDEGGDVDRGEGSPGHAPDKREVAKSFEGKGDQNVEQAIECTADANGKSKKEIAQDEDVRQDGNMGNSTAEKDGKDAERESDCDAAEKTNEGNAAAAEEWLGQVELHGKAVAASEGSVVAEPERLVTEGTREIAAKEMVVDGEVGVTGGGEESIGIAVPKEEQNGPCLVSP
ncbi:hypothetical protein CBR_g52340 [Chara braunii]|uniref:BAH domain-containing protein n=1 Tax=Chara braunii TaxID=69332 RepID=A0A388K6S7_CHABU|nr:hypothetical protein CBR_g52340 [Chara braunii]|eukprot:GBG65748.1 hypothetical protein CBR_g52340 [Chara braunii]